MKITCPSCSATYNVDSSRVPANGMTMRCPKCSHSFRVDPDGAAELPTKPGSATLLDGGGHASTNLRYYVKRPTGKVFGPFDKNAIQMMLKSNKLGGDAEVSTDKQTWQAIGSIPAFAGAVPPEPHRSTMMGGWKGGDNLPAIKADADLPTPAGAGADLPAPSGRLPALPRSTGESDLPVSSSKGAALPTLRDGGDLPVSRSGSDLPGLKGGELPTSSGSNLPTPGAGNLPTSGGRLPIPRTEVDLPRSAGGGGDDLFGTPGEEDALFGASEESDADLFGGGISVGDEESDLFGGGFSDNGAAGDEESDLFGGSISANGAAGDEESDLFGSAGDEDSDLFGGGIGDDDSDLFASPSSSSPPSPPSTPGGDDLFGGGSSDVIGGGKAFSPGDASESDWGDDLFSDKADEPENIAHNAVGGPGAAGSYGSGLDSDLDDWGNDLLDDGARRPQSPAAGVGGAASQPTAPGAPTPEAAKAKPAAKATAGKDDVVREDRKRGMLMLGVPVLLVAVLGAAGYMVYDQFFTGETIVAPAPTAPTSAAQIDVSKLHGDTYGDYVAVIDASRSAKLDSGEERGKALLARSLFLTRYDDEAVEGEARASADALEKASDGFAALGRGAHEARIGNADAARAYLEPMAGKDGDLGFFANALMGIGDVMAVKAEIDRASTPKPPVVEPEAAEGEAADGEAAEQPPEAEAQPEANAAAGEAEVADAEEPAAEQADEIERAPRKATITPAIRSLADRGRNALGNAAKIDAASPLTHYWLGRLEELLGNEDAAIAAYQKATEVSEGHVASRLALGRAFYERGDLNTAITKLETINAELAARASARERADALHFTGLVHAARRQSDLAIEAFTKALSVDSSRSSTLRALAEEYEQAQKYKEALNFFTTNQNLGQNDPEVMLGIVRSHMGLEQWDQAVVQLENATKKFPDDARFPFYLGDLHKRQGRLQAAQKALKQATEIDPDLLTAQATLAQLAWRMDKDLQAGEAHIQEIAKRPEQITAAVATLVADYYDLSGRRELAETWYREGLKRDPNYWPARLALGKHLLEQRDWKAAKELLVKAREEGVQDVRLSAYLADAYRQERDFDRAIEEINKVIEEFPKNEEYVYIRGRIHFDRGNFETAREDFNQAYEINPRYHDAYFYVGRTAYEQGDHNTALKIFRHVLDYQPDRGEYRYHMGVTLEALNRSSQALEEYRKATAVDPGYGVENPRIYIRRGRLLTRLGYPADGKRDIARALELAPEMVDALLAMGESDYADQSYSEAIRHFSRALEMEPEHPDAQYRLGKSLLFEKRQREAAQRLQLAVKYGWEDPEVFQTLGYIYKDLGQNRQAVESFKRFLQQTAEKTIPAATKKEMLRQISELGG